MLKQRLYKKEKKTTENSFWEPGNFKSTTDRMKNGQKLCSALQLLFQERANIEERYAWNLQQFSKLWKKVLDKGPEYGTMKTAMQGILAEANYLSAVHSNVCRYLKSGEFQELKLWQECAFNPICTKIEEYQAMKDLFKEAQKPYAKRLAEVKKRQRKYHKKCEKQRILLNRIQHATFDNKLTPEQKKKFDSYVQKLNSEMEKSHGKYEKSLHELNKYHPFYVHDMTTLFTKCQEMEARRLSLFKTALFSVHKALNMIQDKSLSEIYEDFYNTIDSADYHRDLEWWSKHYGADMNIDVPSYVMLSNAFESIYKDLASPKKKTISKGNQTNPIGSGLFFEHTSTSNREHKQSTANSSAEITQSVHIPNDRNFESNKDNI